MRCPLTYLLSLLAVFTNVHSFKSTSTTAVASNSAAVYLFLITTTCIVQGTAAGYNDNNPPLQAYQSSGFPAIIGITAEGERARTDDSGYNQFQADTNTQIRIFGRDLTNRTSVTFTTHRSNKGAFCNDFSRTEPYALNIAENGSIATVNVKLAEGIYFLCIKTEDSADRRDWFYVGNEPWLSLVAEGPLIPISVQIILLFALLALSGLFSGLNLGLMALDQNDLKVIASCGTEDEKRYAKAIQPIRARGNFLLCSLLLGNVLVNSTLTILLDGLTSGLVAVAGATMSIVIFGEIIPQAICSRHGLAVGAKTISIPYIFMILTFPLSYPISKLLDYILGDEIGNIYDRERLMEYIRITKDYNKLDAEEVNIISGALGLTKITVGEIMTGLEDVFALPLNAKLDFNTVSQIQKRGYSRIPVYDIDRKNIVALFHAKDLAFIDPDDGTPLQNVLLFYAHPLIHTYEDTTLDIVLEDFKQGKSHMAFVRKIYDTGEGDPYYEITGVVTLEDVIEEILQTEIVDETDIISDNRKKQRRKAVIRQDFSDFAKIGEGEQGIHIISPQLALATFQFLCTSIEPFSKTHISETVLRRLLTQKIYFQCKVHEAQLDTGKYNSLGRTERVLYLAGKQADYFIMILEGRVRVTVGKENLVFESGPFSHFGLSALKPPLPGEGLGVLSKASSRHSVSSSHLLSAADRPPSPENSAMKKSPSGSAKYQQLVDPSPPPPAPQTTTALGGVAPLPISSFVSDFTVKVVETALFLKIPRKVYLAAYRATQMERQRDHLSPDHDEDDVYVKDLDRASISNSAHGINRQRSVPSLNHRESTTSQNLLPVKFRKKSNENEGTDARNHQLTRSANANNGLVRFNSDEGRRDLSGSDEARITFSNSLGHSPTPSLEDPPPPQRNFRDNQSSPASLEGGGSPNEASHLV